MPKKNPNDIKRAEHNTRPAQARQQLENETPANANSVVALRALVIMLLDLLNIKYQT